jgi:type VI secretion system protein ImpF
VARPKAEIHVAQSLVDRLTMTSEDWPKNREASIAAFRLSLKRDIVWLFNTRQPIISGIETCPLTGASVYNFGLPDIRRFDGSKDRDQSALSGALEKCIRTFEPRIKQPRVFFELADPNNRSLRFRIEGRIAYEDLDEEIKFDTVLELISGELKVK